MALATFGGGCFWSVEEAFRTLYGVKKTTVGYMGGTLKNPTYEQVCSNKTNHAEVVQIEYDQKVISYPQLLTIFWQVHDPTTINRQGANIGTQYRSIIFYHTKKQQQEALSSKEKEQKKHPSKIVTQILPAQSFYKAEEYHQQYLAKRDLKSCHL
jgi:peptide-methionine (S)-S-oxide reductase